MAKNKKLIKKSSLTNQQMLFCQVYLKNGMNGKQACISAGYSERSAEATASRLLLRNDKVKAYLSECRKKLLNDNEKHAVDWLNKVDNLTNANLLNVAEWDNDRGLVVKNSVDITNKEAYGISEIQSKWNKDSQQYDFKVKMVDRAKALDMKGKFIGTLSEGFEIVARTDKQQEEHKMTVAEKNNRILELLNKANDEPK